MRPRLIDARFLRAWPLPPLGDESDKNARGKLLVVAGGQEMPGIAVLSATAALRAGAGKVRIAAGRGVGTATGLAMPEARIVARNPASLRRQAREMDAVVLGPGMDADRSIPALIRAVLSGIGARPAKEAPSLLLDAEALKGVKSGRGGILPLDRKTRGKVVITPHFGEMASLLDVPKRAIEKDPARVAREFSGRTGIITVLKSSDTYLAGPDGTLLIYRNGPVGLATAGSGDTLAGILGGLLARGTEPLQAAAWAVFLHGEAGRRLTRRIGRVGFLAREIVDEIPAVLSTVTAGK